MERLALPELTRYFAFLLLAATVGPLLFGYHLAELNAPEQVLTCARHPSQPNPSSSPFPQCIPMTTLQFSVVSSIFTLGGFLGALAIGSTATRHGRLRAMLYTTLFFSAGPIAEALATNVTILAVGRLASGIGAGASLVVVPIYVSEISPPARKGLYGSFSQVMCNLGILITQLLGYFLSRGQLWRIILGVGGIIGLTQFVALGFAVESPKWHLDHGNLAQGKRNLQLIRGPMYDIQRDLQAWGFESHEHADGVEQSLLNNEHSAPFQDRRVDAGGVESLKRHVQVSALGILSNPLYRRATIAAVIVMMAQQFTGINSIVMYGVSLLSGLLQQSSALLNVCVSALNVIVTVICAPLSDRLGRKPCLISSILGMGISSLVLAISIQNSLKILAGLATLTFVGSFGVGLGPLPFILASEMVGPEAVGPIQSWALATNWVSTFVVAQFFPILNKSLGNGNVYFLFAAFAAIFATLVWLCVPETKGKHSVEEVWR